MPTVVRKRGWGFFRWQIFRLFLSTAMEGARVTSVISNHCIRTRLLVFKIFLAITVCVMRSTTYRFYVDVCLPDRRWSRASVPLWCILLLAGVVGFTRLSSFMGVFVSLVLCCHFRGHVLALFRIFCYFSTFACR